MILPGPTRTQLEDALAASDAAGLPKIAVSAPHGKWLCLMAQAIGARRMAGVADNLGAMLDDRYSRGNYASVSERTDAPLEDALALIVREPGAEVRAALDAYLREHRLDPRVAMAIPSNETLKASVMAGMGIGFLSLHAVASELRAGLLHVVEFEDTPVVRTWNIVHEASKVLSPAAEAFRYFLLDEAEALAIAMALKAKAFLAIDGLFTLESLRIQETPTNAVGLDATDMAGLAGWAPGQWCLRADNSINDF